MVLYKRKPVRYLERGQIDEDVEVWEIPQTGEVFVDYEQYLHRMDFYKQRRFICQITGHSGLSFFDALKSEQAGAEEVEEAFPEPLKGVILRRVQFQTISRIDTLVDLIYDEYKGDYYPGEAVTVHVLTGERLTGIVRDKTRFGAKVLPDGTTSASFSRYFVSLDNRPTEEAVVDDAHITRDRKVFTKQVLRSFIKKTVTRDAWNGAPWLVKHEVAAQYNIDTRVPPHLRFETKAAERKAIQQQKKTGPEFGEMVGSFSGNGNMAAPPSGSKGLPDLKPKSHKSKQQQQGQTKSKQQSSLNPAPSHPNPPTHFFAHPVPQQQFVAHNFQAHGPLPQQLAPPFPNFQHQNQFGYPPPYHQPLPPPPPPVKYPTEDLQVPPRVDGPKRPNLKYFSQDSPIEGLAKEGNGIFMKHIGALLESWDTLNVYCEVYKLDSFTFDDFVEAMQFSSEDVDCELFVEIHCAVLKLLVDSDGRVLVGLPEMTKPELEEEEGEDEATVPSPTPEPEPKPSGRATRSSLAKAEAEAIKADANSAREPTAEPKSNHRAEEMQLEESWIERLKKRDFKHGGWQVIIVGLLYQLSKNPRRAMLCEIILKELAPLHMEPTKETARIQYSKLNVNLRIEALSIMTMLCAETKAFRMYMDQCSEEMTAIRKEKIKWQRDRKQYTADLVLLNDERKLLLPANMPPSPVVENKPLNGDVKMTDAEEEMHDSEDNVLDTEDDPTSARALRKGADRAIQRKRKREEEQEKKEKAEAEAKVPKQSKQFTKLLKDIAKKQELIKECEEEIAVHDNDLREADCPRTRVLGKDRFWNRYYWFERNGMPYGGLPGSSTAHAGYANGCIWVQGPDDIERLGYIELQRQDQDNYRAKFNMSVPERKMLEEGETHLFTAYQWGYYDDPASVDGLIGWLDSRGVIETKLKKELIAYRKRITDHMEARLKYLNPKAASEEVEVDTTNKRTSTRRAEKHADHATHRCLSWHNTTAIDELGHLHIDEPRARKPANKKSAAATVVEPEERVTRSDARGKKGKEKAMPSRQGTRYDF